MFSYVHVLLTPLHTHSEGESGKVLQGLGIKLPSTSAALGIVLCVSCPPVSNLLGSACSPSFGELLPDLLLRPTSLGV